MAGRLKPLNVEREEKPGKYADGDGLYLIVAGPRSKNWSYRYWFKGEERWHGLGSFKDVSLKQARLLRNAARLQVRAGVDLVKEKRVAKQTAKATEAAEKAKAFKECAQTYIDEHWNAWSEKRRNQWPSSLKRYGYPPASRLMIRCHRVRRHRTLGDFRPLRAADIQPGVERNAGVIATRADFTLVAARAPYPGST
jgi:hypothetical protein